MCRAASCLVIRAAQAVGVFLPSLSFPFRIGEAVQRAQRKLQVLKLSFVLCYLEMNDRFSLLVQGDVLC